MSTMFMAALEKHIAQLKEKVASSNPDTIKKQLAATEALIAVTTDGRKLRRLNNDVADLKAHLAEVGNQADTQKLITDLTNVHAKLRQNPAYTKQRKPRQPRATKGTKKGKK